MRADDRIPVIVGWQQLGDTGPTANVRPPDVHRDDGHVLGVLHHAIVNRLLDDLGPDPAQRRLVTGRAERGFNLRQLDVEFGHLAAELLQYPVDAPDEHAAVPRILAAIHHVHRRLQARLLGEPVGAEEREPIRRAQLLPLLDVPIAGRGIRGPDPQRD